MHVRVLSIQMSEFTQTVEENLNSFTKCQRKNAELWRQRSADTYWLKNIVDDINKTGNKQNIKPTYQL